MTPYRIVLANNHAPLRQGIKRILDEQPELEMVGEASDGRELLNLLRSGEVLPHLVILDLSLPDLHGPEAILKVKDVLPGTKVLTLSMHEDVEYLGQALANGAEGCLIRECVDKELVRAIETIRQGKVYAPPVLADLIPGWPHTNPIKGR
jgi:two-component system, NarL family, response regulator NreC